MTDASRSLADVLRTLRQQRNMTQEELADASYVAQNTISTIERGITTAPQRATLARLADALHVDLADLYIAAQYARTKALAKALIAVEQGADPMLAIPPSDPRHRLLADFQRLTPDQQEVAVRQVAAMVKRAHRKGAHLGEPSP